jgi:hypothetical protein
MHDISDDVFDNNHVYYDEKGEQIHIPAKIKSRSIANGANNEEEMDDDGAIHSVYLATGIHHQVTEDVLEDLPDRFDKSSVKARLNWFGALCMAGIGMFVEAYIIITTGQVKTVWHAAYPSCWGPTAEQHCPANIQCCGLFPNTPFDDDTDTCTVDTKNDSLCNADGTFQGKTLCEESILGSISYTEFAGIMIGMIAFGVLGDVIGRKSAGIVTSILMIVGVTVMTFVDTTDHNLDSMFLIWAIFFGIFGLGVGGEYPLSAAGAAEHHSLAIEEAKKGDGERHRWRILRDHERTVRRGETIGIVFAMQGIGAVVGSIFLLVLLYFSGQYKTQWYALFLSCNLDNR